MMKGKNIGRYALHTSVPGLATIYSDDAFRLGVVADLTMDTGVECWVVDREAGKFVRRWLIPARCPHGCPEWLGCLACVGAAQQRCRHGVLAGELCESCAWEAAHDARTGE